MSFPGAFIDPHTGQSLLRDTKVVVIIAQGGAYGAGGPREGWDFQTPYLRTYFGKHGVTEGNVCFVSAEMTKAGLVPHLARFPAAGGEFTGRGAGRGDRAGHHDYLLYRLGKRRYRTTRSAVSRRHRSAWSRRSGHRQSHNGSPEPEPTD